MPFSESWLQYLTELRHRLIYCLLFFVIIFVVLAYFANPIYHLVAAPLLKYLPPNNHMIAATVTGSFYVPLRLAFMLSAIIIMPLFLYHVWAFVTPALHQSERLWLWPILLASTILFYAGLLFAYYLVLPILFKFFVAMLPPEVMMMTDMGHYLDFISKMVFVFGIVFEVPIIVWALVKSQLVQLEQLQQARPYIIVGAFIMGMLLTADVVSQLLLAIPVCLLFELGIMMLRITKGN